MKTTVQALLALCLAFSFAFSPLAQSQDAPKPVLDVLYVNPNGDVAGFLAIIAKGRSIAQKLRPDAEVEVKVYMLTKAGPYVGTIMVAVQHASLEDWAEGQRVLAASPEWQALIKEVSESDFKVEASNLSVELASFD